MSVPDGWGNTGECYIAPRNEADGRIQKVWQDILEINRIGIDDNFFMLGGNSIKAIQVVAKLALDFQIGINDIFQCQTIRNLSDTIKYYVPIRGEDDEEAKIRLWGKLEFYSF